MTDAPAAIAWEEKCAIARSVIDCAKDTMRFHVGNGWTRPANRAAKEAFKAAGQKKPKGPFLAALLHAARDAGLKPHSQFRNRWFRPSVVTIPALQPKG